MKKIFLLFLSALVFVGCTKKTDDKVVRKDNLTVVTTIGMIADLVKEIGGSHVEVVGLMGAGVDPHLYKASEGDVRRLSSADIVFYNGLNLEGKMGDVLVKMSRNRPVIPVTEDVNPSLLREPPEFMGHYDPHVWFDVTLWMKAAEKIRDTLVEHLPQFKNEIIERARQYQEQLLNLHNWVKQEILTIDKKHRVLVTAHDAFGYFGRQYDMEVVGLQGISTATEAGVGDVNRIVDLILSRKIKAIFVETSVPKRTIEAVQAACKSKGHDVKIGGTLFSDAMGAAGTREGTYLGMVRSNVLTIVLALK